ncbi:hypothetical protein I315_02450 [Cryptococcus gattii Ru294]|nr:hypothetical protein I315_02450 [Cryptococcus gattii Ru294]
MSSSSPQNPQHLEQMHYNWPDFLPASRWPPLRSSSAHPTMGSEKYQIQRKIVGLNTDVRSDNLMVEKPQQGESAFENPSASPDEIDYFTETRMFRLRHAMEEDGCGMMSSSAPPTLLTKVTGEVWKELRPSIDIETGFLMLDAQSQTSVQVRESQGVYNRDKYEYYAAPAIDLETGYCYDRLLRAKLEKASSLDQSTPAPEHSTHPGHTGLGDWTTPHHTLKPFPPPDQLADLQQTSIYSPLSRSTVSPPVPPLKGQRAVIEWQPSLLPLHALPLPSSHASLDVSVPALYHPASIFGPFAGELPAAPQPVTHHPPQTELCVAQIPSQELIRQTTCLNMQLQGCSQTHIHPDLVSPLPPNAIFLRRVVSTQGGTQGFYGLSAHENKDGQYVSISATNDGDHLPPPNYPHGSYLTPSPHHVPSSIMTNHLHSLSVPGQEGMPLIGVGMLYPTPPNPNNPVQEGFASLPPLPKKKRGSPRPPAYPNYLVEKSNGEGKQEKRPGECTGQEGLEFGRRSLPKTAITCNFCRLKKLKAPLAHIVNDSVIVNVCTKSLATDVDQAKKEGKGKKIVIFLLLRMSYYLRPADIPKSLCVRYGQRAKEKRQATLFVCFMLAYRNIVADAVVDFFLDVS